MEQHSIDIIWSSLLEMLLEEPIQESRDGDCREMTQVVFNVDPRRCVLMNRARKFNRAYAAAEFIWYMRGDRDVRMMEAYAPSYKRFASGPLDHYPQSYGAYGPRINSQLTYVLDLLKNRPNTRQAVMSIWSPEDVYAAYKGGHNDIPCTLSLNFLLRKGKLHLTTTMRSNDVWLGVPYDVFCFCTLQTLMAATLGVEVGYYQHQVMSLHLYTRNEKKAHNCVRFNDETYETPLGTRLTDENLISLISYEEAARTSQAAARRNYGGTTFDMLSDWIGIRWC